MKILLVMDPYIPVPPIHYGGIERVVYDIAVKYIEMGHEVHLLAAKGSAIKNCTIHAFGNQRYPPTKWDVLRGILKAWKFLWQHRNKFDLIHNFGRLIYLLPVLNCKVKKLMTYEREISARNILYINKLPNKNLIFTGCSQNLISRIPASDNWHAVHNGIEFSIYDLQESLPSDAPFMFLGRIERIKGCHNAIAAAKATNSKLVIAGNLSYLPEEQEYFKNEIEPLLDGDQIKYVGPVNDIQKNEYIGKSKALLFPIEWNEPFGIVMIEAMACGTPVIGFNFGSVNEVIDENITGFKVSNLDEMILAMKKINIIDRKTCREHAEKRFDIKVIAHEYINLFHKSLKRD